MTMTTVRHEWGIAEIALGSRLVTVSDGVRSYRIALDGAVTPEAEAVARLAPRPTDATDGALLRFVSSYGEKPGYVGDHIVVQVQEAKDDVDPLTSVGDYYVVSEFGSAEAVKLAPEPRFRLVAIDETDNWVDEVKAITGEIQGVHLYDENAHTHLCEVTPSHWLEFLFNAPQNSIGDGDDERPQVPGMDAGRFEYENGGEYGCYMHVHDVERIPDAFKHDCGPVHPRDLEHYRCAPEHLRDALYDGIKEGFREHFVCNREFEGHFERPAAIGFV